MGTFNTARSNQVSMTLVYVNIDVSTPIGSFYHLDYKLCLNAINNPDYPILKNE